MKKIKLIVAVLGITLALGTTVTSAKEVKHTQDSKPVMMRSVDPGDLPPIAP